MTQFSDGTAGFVYTAIRPQPVSLLCSAVLCSALLQKMRVQSLEGRNSQPWTTRECNQKFLLCSEATSVVKFFTGGGETREHFVLQFCLKWFFEKTLHRCTAVFSLDKVGHTVEEEKNRRQHFQACVRGTALRGSRRGGQTKAFWIYKTFIFYRICYIFSRKGCLCCAMQENSHSFLIWEEYSGERSRKKAMEYDRRDREPCLSPAAFVNQVQYSNILEGRFKQLQGKSHNDLSIWG